MKFKLDENIGTRGAARLRSAGHDVTTVAAESLGGADDQASKPATLAEIELAVDTLIRGLQAGPVEGKLWIVDRGMIREYQPPE